MRTPAPISYLRLIIGLFFVAIGVFAIIGMQNNSMAVGQDIVGVQIVFGVVEVLGGLALLIGVFTSFRIAYIQLLSVILFFAWLLKIILNVLSLAVPGFPSDSGVALDATGWIVSFALQLSILSGLYVVQRDYNML